MSLFTDECLELLEQIDKWAVLDQKARVTELLQTELGHIRRTAADSWKVKRADDPWWNGVARPPRR